MFRRHQRTVGDEMKPGLTPMIDVTFLILIFFMCTLKFKTLENLIESALPLDKGLSPQASPLPVDDLTLQLRVRAQDVGKPMEERRVAVLQGAGGPLIGTIVGVVGKGTEARVRWEPADAPERLGAWIRDGLGAVVDLKVKIDADAATPHLHVVSVLDLVGRQRVGEVKVEHITWTGIPATVIRDLETGRTR